LKVGNEQTGPIVFKVPGASHNRTSGLEGFRLWKFDAAAFQSRGNKNLLAVRVGSRNPNG